LRILQVIGGNQAKSSVSSDKLLRQFYTTKLSTPKFLNMKKILLVIFVLYASLAQAGYKKGKIIFLNGDIKEGYVEYFELATENKVSFKATLQGEKEKLKSDDLKEIIWDMGNGKHKRILRLKYAEIRNKEGRLKIFDDKSWFSVIYAGDFEVVSFRTTGKGLNAESHCIHWKNDDYATMLAMAGNVIGRKKIIRDRGPHIFKGKCDTLADALKNKTFEPNNIDELIAWYEKNCGNE